jgi:hypothetical protein
MDEIFGYFPPVANPPSKQPLLTLLKQARAFGLGVVLATQNPVDLDYKGLSNAGTWFIGRLQAERDRNRVLDGLERAAGSGFDRGHVEKILAQLGNRVFLMNNVHEDRPVVFETRWAMSYLRGPLTRSQIKSLMAPKRGGTPNPPGSTPAVSAPAAAANAVAPAGKAEGEATSRPVLPPEVPQYFVPVRGSGPPDAVLLYQPKLLGSAQVRFVDTKTKINCGQDLMLLTPIESTAIAVDWQNASEAAIDLDALEREPAAGASFESLPAAAAKAKSYTGWSRDLVAWLYGNKKLPVIRCPRLKQTSGSGESERDFRLRVQHAAREERDRAVEKLRQSYAPKAAALEEKIRRASQAAEREREEAGEQGLSTAFSVGATLLGAFLGRKPLSARTLGRAAGAARSGSRAWKETQDVARARETVDALHQQLADLEQRLAAEIQELDSSVSAASETFETVSVSLKKTNIAVRLVALAWIPCWRDSQGNVTPAY